MVTANALVLSPEQTQRTYAGFSFRMQIAPLLTQIVNNDPYKSSRRNYRGMRARGLLFFSLSKLHPLVSRIQSETSLVVSEKRVKGARWMSFCVSSVSYDALINSLIFGFGDVTERWPFNFQPKFLTLRRERMHLE